MIISPLRYFMGLRIGGIGFAVLLEYFAPLRETRIEIGFPINESVELDVFYWTERNERRGDTSLHL